jgi:hypothetical protein
MIKCMPYLLLWSLKLSIHLLQASSQAFFKMIISHCSHCETHRTINTRFDTPPEILKFQVFWKVCDAGLKKTLVIARDERWGKNLTRSRHRQHDNHARPIVALRPWDQLCVARYSHHNTNIVVNRRDAWCYGWCNITQRAPDAAIAPSPSTRGQWLSIWCLGVAIGGVGSRRRPISMPWLVGFEDGSTACEVW